jgi:hypothetical protein
VLITESVERSATIIGRWGTVARVLGGSALIILATAVWQADWLDLAIGLVALPALFYGSMALIAGVLGNGACEITVLANLLRGRDDRVGCPIFGPLDVLDRQLATRRDGAR